MRPRYEDVASIVSARIPEFVPEVEEHLRDHGEVLQHLLFGDLTRFVLRAADAGDAELVGRCLELLDELLRSGDERVNNLVAISFVENVPPWDPERAAFIETWPAGLRAEALAQRAWTPNA